MGLNLKEKPDFGGWATVYDVRCGDGRTLRKGAFRGSNGTKVPIVYNHDHNNLDSVLGHAYLEERDEGIYAYGYLNDSYEGQAAKERVKHGDIGSLSIYANKLKEKGGDVYHGIIREVSLVLASANPKSRIETVLTHSDSDNDEWEAEMYFNEPIDTEFELVHSDDYIDPEGYDEEEPEEDEDMAADRTVGDVYDEMTEEQQAAVDQIVNEAVSNALDEYDEALSEEYDDEDEEDYYDEGEEDDMRHNAFENDYDEYYGDEIHVLSHSEIEDMFSDAKTLGSLRASVLAHTDDYGIENIDYMFPDARLNEGDPQFIKRPDGWVDKVISGTSHSAFARIKSLFADITEDEARAKGYIKGNLKKEEVFTMLKRKTEPTTVYKKQKIDRDDVIDIKDFDVVAMIKREMREMLNEEIARAILVGDGRPNSSDEKVKEANIRPIWKEEDLFVVKKTVDVAANASADVKAKTFIRTAIKARKDYRGSGNPTLFTTEDMLTDMLLMEDNMGRVIYDTEEKLRTKLRVKEIVTVPVMEGLSRDEKGQTRNLMGIIVNLSDYKVGTDKGGEINMFDDFDIDYNQQKYLIETRMSGALVKPYSAIILEEAVNVTLTVEPTDPSETRYGKEVDDLQANIQINEGSQQILGTLRYVTGYTGYSGDPNLQSGNFLSLDLSATPAESAVIKAELIGGTSEGNPVTVDDGILVIRITDKKQKIHITATNGENVIERTYGLGSLKLKTNA